MYNYNPAKIGHFPALTLLLKLKDMFIWFVASWSLLVIQWTYPFIGNLNLQKHRLYSGESS